MEQQEQELITVKLKDWEKIPRDYKARWTSREVPEYVGKRTVLSGCIMDSPGTALLVEGVHFKIV